MHLKITSLVFAFASLATLSGAVPTVQEAMNANMAKKNSPEGQAAMSVDKQAVPGSSFITAVDPALSVGISSNVGVAAFAPNDHSVLILSTTNGHESITAASLGLTPVVVTPAQWSAMTAAQFASFRSIILGDQFCTSVAAVAAAEANVNVWSPIVKGNVIIDGTDPSFHLTFGSNNAGAQSLQSAEIAYSANQKQLTGAYISLSCYYTSPTVQLVNVLKGFGTFRVTGATTCDGNQQIVAPQPGTPLAPLTNANLQNWFCSTHEFFTQYPSSFTKFAVTHEPNGAKPYILLRKANCCLGTFTSSACCGGVTGNDVFTCVNQQAIQINTCAPPVPHCQNVPLGVTGGLLIESAVCNI